MRRSFESPLDVITFTRNFRSPLRQIDKTQVRWHSLSERFFWRELDVAGNVTAQGVLDAEDMPEVVQRIARERSRAQGSPYVDWPLNIP